MEVNPGPEITFAVVVAAEELDGMPDPGKSGTRPEFGAQMVEAALQTAVGAILIIDDRGLIQNINSACEKVFGFSAQELIGNNVSLLMPEPYRSRHDGYVKHHLDTGERRII